MMQPAKLGFWNEILRREQSHHMKQSATYSWVVKMALNGVLQISSFGRFVKENVRKEATRFVKGLVESIDLLKVGDQPTENVDECVRLACFGRVVNHLNNFTGLSVLDLEIAECDECIIDGIVVGYEE
jgi:hypothetical protein